MSNTHDVLAKVVAEVKCMPDWTFRLEKAPDDVFPKLVIRMLVRETSTPDQEGRYYLDHLSPVPEATYNEKSWRRWVFERCRSAMTHELGEWFRIGDERPFAPLHAPGEDPYTVHEFRPIEDMLTTQDGSMREPYLDVPDGAQCQHCMILKGEFGWTDSCILSTDGKHLWKPRVPGYSPGPSA